MLRFYITKYVKRAFSLCAITVKWMQVRKNRMLFFHAFPSCFSWITSHFHGKSVWKWDFHHLLYNFCLCIKAAGGKNFWPKSQNYIRKKTFKSKGLQTRKGKVENNALLIFLSKKLSPFFTSLYFFLRINQFHLAKWKLKFLLAFQSSLLYNRSARHERLECNTRDKSAARLRHK